MHSRRSSGGSTRGYAETIDPFVALAAVAAVTTTLTLGTAVCLVAQRDPIITAKEVASLDQLCGGRFQFGVGAGWNRIEMANHGTDPRTRLALLADRVRAMREIWTAEQAETKHCPHWTNGRRSSGTDARVAGSQHLQRNDRR